MRPGLFASVFLTALAATSPLHAEPVDEAEAAYAQLRYDDAHDTASAVVDGADDDSDAVARARRVLGSIAAIRGDEDAAVEHFVLMLDADSEATLEDDPSPKIQRPYKAALARHALRAGVRAPPEAPADGGDTTRPPDPVGTPDAAPSTPATGASSERSPPPRAAEEGAVPDWLIWSAVGLGVVVVVVGVAAAVGVAIAAAPADPCAGAIGCVRPR